tara:strand:- start:1581 stop:2081 length:501 start_codon:yes stop_codon:yes gene_type:complete
LIVFLGLGSNIGNRLVNLSNVLHRLNSIGIKIIKESPIYETNPKYKLDQKKFYNQVIKVKTDFYPETLLKYVKNIEFGMGRDLNAEKNSARIIDIDILAFEDMEFSSIVLIIPHPLLHERQFILQPWNDIEPDYIVPKLEKSVNQLFLNLNNKENLLKVNEQKGII